MKHHEHLLIIVALFGVLPAGCNLDFSSLGSTTLDPLPNETNDPPPEGNGDNSPDPVPTNSYCNPVADWDDGWAALEEEVIELMNAHRAQGADCGSAGIFEPTHSLTVDPALRCAARNHSLDMNVRDFSSHTNPDGDGPGERIRQAGYQPLSWGENIAAGYPSPQAVVDGWMNSDGHCANIMRAGFTEVGIGFYEGNYYYYATFLPTDPCVGP